MILDTKGAINLLFFSLHFKNFIGEHKCDKKITSHKQYSVF